ncbi:81_t:CDS:2 [Rhizophagus irregularis]|nr:81_t:CDS:2 [Rhizophagus irregularis]
MSYFPRADDFAPAPGYDHTPAGPDDFIFNHDTTRTVPPTEDKNQQFTAPIKHLRYKKKFIEPSKGYYTFPISFPETKTVPAPAIAETICNVSSVASISNGNPISSVNTDNWENIPEHYIPLIPQSAIYEGGRLNQPSRMKIWKKNLQPLAVGSDGWLAHMKEIYDHHGTMTKYEQERIIAKIQWDTTPTKANTERIYAIL